MNAVFPRQTAPSLMLLPAVDISEGRAVRPVLDSASTKVMHSDPLAVALDWQRQGAQWVHLVDLDAAFGRGSNAALLAEIIQQLDIPVQLSGGIQDAASLAAALATGAERINLGTGALEDPAWCDRVVGEYGDRVAVGLDVRGRVLSARGGNKTGGDLYEAVTRLDRVGCARYVLTDVVKDGRLSGPNLALYREFCAHTNRPVIASGGVSTVEDLQALLQLSASGLEGVIVGKALYTAAFTITEALEILGK